MRKYLPRLLIAAVAVAMAYVLIDKLPFLALEENWLSDYRIATLQPAEPQHPDIVVAAITEDTLKLFPYRAPADRRFLAGLLADLDAAGVRAVGVDVLFDQPTEAAKDQELRQALASMKAPVVVSYAGAEEGLDEDQRDYLDEFVPAPLRGYATLRKDGYDSVVREMFEGRGATPGFALALARKVEPARAFAAEAIAWRGAPSADKPAFRRYPAHAVKLLPKALLKDKIVLIGADLTFTDRHRTPFHAGFGPGDHLMPGVDIHAHALAQLLDGRHRTGTGLATRIGLCAVAALAAVGISLLPWAVWLKVALALVAMAGLWVGGFGLYAAKGIDLPLFMPSLALSLALWLSETLGNRQERLQKQFIKSAFGLYMSPTLVDELVREPAKLSLGGSRREITFMFTDVAGFTTVSEQIEPSELGGLLNRYFDGLCALIMEEGGTVVDFIGDAVFCVFGAPVHQPDHARRAVTCAGRIRQFSDQFLADEAVRRVGWGPTRIGVHTGTALVGNFGSGKRFKYSAVGDPVNTASRVEGLNKFFGTTMCVTETALEAMDPPPPMRPLGRFTLKGKARPVAVFEPVAAGWSDGEAGRLYLEAYAAMETSRPEEALVRFLAMSERGLADDAVAFHIARLKAGETSDVVVMKDK
jgi:class 3 adenylate cyclase